MNKRKSIGGLIIGVFYLAAIVLGLFLFTVFPFSSEQPLLALFVVDIICTVFIYLGSLLFKNASMYDPYWSVAPMVLVPSFCIILKATDVYSWILVALVEVWGLRLTINWWIHFKGLETEDFRYAKYRQSNPKTFFLISFFGFHLMPTLLVFFGLFPAFYFITNLVDGASGLVPTALTILAMVLTLGSVVLETVADIQMLLFKKKSYHQGQVCEEGLWKTSRHPNYLGEICFWFSLFVWAASLTVDAWVLLASPALIFLLFAFISAPMMDRRQLESKANFQDYYFHTNMFLLWPKVTEEEAERNKKYYFARRDAKKKRLEQKLQKKKK
jgi:steroid 5-alpha reductase family enzyme